MTITLTREEAQQLLEVFELFLEEAEDVTTLEDNLVKMLRTRLSAPEPEPVAWVPVHPKNGPLWSMTTDDPNTERLPSYPLMNLYTATPQQSKSEPVAKLFGTLPVYETSVSLKDAVKQEPVAWVENLTDAQPHCVIDLNYCSVAQHKRGDHLKYIPLYTDPTPCKTCEALARTVMMDQTSHDTAPPQREWQSLTDEEITLLTEPIYIDRNGMVSGINTFARAIAAKIKEKNYDKP
jgi:hypothetical protein